MTRIPLATALLSVALLAAVPVQAQGVIKIGEVNSYKVQPAFLEPYKKGMELAVEEINAAGGLIGKKVVLITRDDNGSPGDAVQKGRDLGWVKAGKKLQRGFAGIAVEEVLLESDARIVAKLGTNLAPLFAVAEKRPPMSEHGSQSSKLTPYS